MICFECDFTQFKLGVITGSLMKKRKDIGTIFEKSWEKCVREDIG